MSDLDYTADDDNVPVYFSRFCYPIPEPFGSHVDWHVGQRCKCTSPTTGNVIGGTIVSGETMKHPDAPLIPGAKGYGRWVRIVRMDDNGQDWTISEACLTDE
jgi:hypothetical protein